MEKRCLLNCTQDTISSCALGVDAGSIRGEADKKFLAAVKDIFNMKTHEAILSVLYLIPPVRFALDRLKVPLVKPRSTKFFHSLLTQTLRHRRETGERRNDLIDLMVAATKEGEVSGDPPTATSSDAKGPKKANLDEFLIVATAMVLLVAGYDTSGNTLGMALWGVIQ